MLLLIIINLILCRHTFLFFCGIAGLPFGVVAVTTVLLGFLVLMPFGVLTWYTVINLILCCQLNFMLLIIINLLILIRHTLLFFCEIVVVLPLFGVVAVTTTLLGFLVLLPFGVLTWFTVINLILCY